MDGQHDDDTPSMTQEQRRAAAIELRLGGWTWDKIAQRLGYYDRSHASRDARIEIERISAEQRDNALHLRDLIFERYERLIAANWEAALGGDTDAAENVRRITADQVKLLGLAAAVKVDLGKVREVFTRLLEGESSPAPDDPDDDETDDEA